MGQVHIRPDPTTLCPFPPPVERTVMGIRCGPAPGTPFSSWTAQEQEWWLEEYCRSEALRELQSWFRGAPYRFTPWDEHWCPPDPEVKPLRFVIKR